jgi:hypothetical protein
VLPLLLSAGVFAEDYKGPQPPKADLPYLLHASELVATEATDASQENQKKSSATYTIAGASSPVKTPLAEPVFILQSKLLDPATLELWRFDVKNGQRTLAVSSGRHGKAASGPFHLSVTKIGDHLYRIEVQDMLENGEYSLSPTGSNRAFCFQVY